MNVNKMNLKTILIPILIFGLLDLELARANVHCKSKNVGKNFTSINEFNLFFLENHPDLKVQEFVQKELLGKVKVAEQRINPEIDLETQYGESKDKKEVGLSVSYLHTFELGSKRESRIKLAISESEESYGIEREIQERIFHETTLNLFKIKNFKEQNNLYNEIIETFKGIINQYQNRHNLNPEQRVSLTTFQVALQEYILKNNLIENEISEMENYFQVVLGHDCKIEDVIQIKEIASWPQLNYSEEKISEDFSKLKLSLANIKMKESFLEVEKSKSFSDLKIGPTLGTKLSKGEKDYSVGLSLTVSLPIFNKNDAGKSQALTSLNSAKQIEVYTKSKIQLEKKKWIKIYQKSAEGIKGLQSIKNLTEKHRIVDRSFREGIISSSIVLELHRQLIDFTISKQDQGISALNALLNIYAIEGRILSADLGQL